MKRRVVEICVADLASAQAAARGGADRVELCADLASGGVTPSIGPITQVVRESGLPVHVLIRPRGGDFVYDFHEQSAMLLDIDAAQAAGAAGVVLGALAPTGQVDLVSTARLIDRARPLSVTFHKAIDLTPDPLAAIDDLIALGVDRVLTSGGVGPAREHTALLRAMIERASGRLVVMAGGGINESDLPGLLDTTGVCEVHLGSGVTGPSGQPGPFGVRPARVEEERVRRVMRLIKGVSQVPSPSRGEGVISEGKAI